MSEKTSEKTNGVVAEEPGWIALQAPPEVVALLERMAKADFTTKSAFVRGLIVNEARSRGLLPAESVAESVAQG